MKKIEAIKKKMEKLNKEKPGTVMLNPPISIDQVRAFEEKYRITLPKEYVEFVTLVGDGGKIQLIPECSGVEITELGRYEEFGYPLEKIGMQFPLKKGWMPDFGDQIEGTEDIVDEDVLDEMTGDHWEKIETQGNIIVMADDESSWRLIVNGERKGEVWQLSEFGIQRLIKCSFLRLLELYLSGGLNEYAIECRDREYPGEPDPIKDCRDTIKKIGLKMNPPIDTAEVREFEKRHNIQFPEEYVALLTEVGYGIKKTSSYSSIKEIYLLSELDCLDDLDKPFLIQTEEDYRRIFYDGNGNSRRFSWKGKFLYPFQEKCSMWEFIYHKKDFGKKAPQSPWMLPQFELLHGCIPLVGSDNRLDGTLVQQYLLVLNGAYKGKIFWADETEMCLVDGTPKYPINALSIIGAIAYGGR